MDEDRVEAYEGIRDALYTIANGINPPGTEPGNDAYGGVICSLVEAVMGIPYGLKDVADAIREHGWAIKESALDITGAIEKGEKGDAS